MFLRITILRGSVERPKSRPLKRVFLLSLHYLDQRFSSIWSRCNSHKKIPSKQARLSKSIALDTGGLYTGNVTIIRHYRNSLESRTTVGETERPDSARLGSIFPIKVVHRFRGYLRHIGKFPSGFNYLTIPYHRYRPLERGRPDY